jgi:hypothetical protein
MKTADFLQLAAALAAGCSAFLTNDRQLPTVPGIRILQFASYIRSVRFCLWPRPLEKCLAVAVDKLYGNADVPQASHSFSCQRPRNLIASGHDLVNFRSSNLLKYGFECGVVRVNVVDGSQPYVGHSTQDGMVRENLLIGGADLSRSGARTLVLGGSWSREDCGFEHCSLSHLSLGG